MRPQACAHGSTAACTADQRPTCRIAACFAVVFVCWDLKAVFYTIWGPLTFLMGYSDPRKPTNDLLHGASPPTLSEKPWKGTHGRTPSWRPLM